MKIEVDNHSKTIKRSEFLDLSQRPPAHAMEKLAFPGHQPCLQQLPEIWSLQNDKQVKQYCNYNTRVRVVKSIQ